MIVLNIKVVVSIFAGVLAVLLALYFGSDFDASESYLEENMEMHWKNATSVYDFTVNDITGVPVKLEKYRGYVLLIVNVASKCGLTATNYKELVELDESLRYEGLRILAFPCNQFGGQEPGSPNDIVCFMRSHHAEFDMFEKINVNGEKSHPLYKYLKYKVGGTLGDSIKWNFTKFIIDREGQPRERFSPMTNPKELTDKLKTYLGIPPRV